MNVEFVKVSEKPNPNIKECEERVARCWEQIHIEETHLFFHMGKAGRPGYDIEMIQRCKDRVETQKIFLRKAQEALVFALQCERDDKKALIAEVLELHEQKTKAGTSKKPLSKAQQKRNQAGGRGRTAIDDEFKGIILAEWNFIKNQTNRRKSELLAKTCANGKWTHNKKLTTIITRRLDGGNVMPDNILKYVKRHSPKKDDKK